MDKKIPIFQTNEIDLNPQGNDNISINNSKSENRIVNTNEPINKKEYKKTHDMSHEEDEENEIEESDSETEYEINSTLKTFKYEKVMIKGEPLGLICQNIKYFGDGNISKWDSKKPKYGIQIRKKMSIDSVNKSNKELKKNPIKNDDELFNKIFKSSTQKINDHKLEFFTYSSIKGIKNKKKERIFSGEGPFKLVFKKIKLNGENDKYNRIYLNIDGEYLNLIKPKEMRIRLSKINNGTLKFAKRNEG